MGGGRLRAFADCSPAPDRLCLISVAPALSIIPALFSSFLRPLRHSCAGRNPESTHPNTHPSSPIPSRGEVRWGVEGCERLPTALLHPIAYASSPSHPRSPSFLLSSRHSCPLSVIPAQAGTHLAQYSFPAPFPNSSLPPSRGEVRWGVEGCERLPTALLHPIAYASSPSHPRSPSFLLSSRHSCPLSVIPAQAGTHAVGGACLDSEHPAARRSGLGGRRDAKARTKRWRSRRFLPAQE